jgi:hypothetical protein
MISIAAGYVLLTAVEVAGALVLMGAWRTAGWGALLLGGVLFLYLPGWALGEWWAFWRRRREGEGDPTGAPGGVEAGVPAEAAAFRVLDRIGLSVACCVIAFALGFILGVSFRAVMGAIFVLQLVLAGGLMLTGGPSPLDLRRGARPGPSVLDAALFVAAAVLVATSGATLPWNSDGPDHLAFVREVVEENDVFPDRVFYADGDGTRPDPRKGFLHPTYAALWLVSGLDPIRFWQLLPALMLPLHLLAFSLFARATIGWSRAFWVPGLLLLATVGGADPGWLDRAAYPSTMILPVAWMAGARFLEARGTGVRGTILTGALILGTGVLVHLFAYPLALVTLLCLLPAALTRRGEGPTRLPAAAAFAAGGLPFLLWRAFVSRGEVNFIHGHEQGMLEIAGPWVTASPVEWWSYLGWAGILAMGVLPFLGRDLRGRRAVLGLCLLPPALLLVPFLSSVIFQVLRYLAVRFLLLVPPALVLCLAFRGGLRRGWSRRGLLRRSALLVSTAVLLVLGVVPQLEARASRYLADRSPEPEAWKKWAGLTSRLEELQGSCVLLSDPVTSYLIPALTRHHVVCTLHQHGSPLDPRDVERSRLVRDVFLAPSRALDRLSEEEVDFVLVHRRTLGLEGIYWAEYLEWASPVDSLDAHPHAFRKVEETEHYALYRVPADREGWSGAGTAARPAPPAAESARAQGPLGFPEGVELAAWHLSSSRVRPGGTLGLDLSWRRSSPIEDPRPLWAIARINARVPESSLFSKHYGKIFRRFLEIGHGILYRQRRDFVLRGAPDPGHGELPPDLWREGVIYRHHEDLPVFPDAVREEHTLHIQVRARAFLENYRLSDWLRDDDSFQHYPLASFRVTEHPGRSP